MPELAVVTVNYRCPRLVVDCLRSLAGERASFPGFAVYVVDNASGDDSIEQIGQAIAAEGWGGWVTLIAHPVNGGFSAGNNAAIRPLLDGPEPPPWFLLLNPDAYVRPGAIAALMAAARRPGKVGVIGCRLEHPDGTPQPAAFRFQTPLTEFERGLRLGIVSRLLTPWSTIVPPTGGAARVEWVSGASLLVRREVFEEVGLLDDGYFLYFEEVDLCLRCARAGWEVWHEPGVRVVHLVGRSTGISPVDQERPTPGYVFESRRRFFVKNHGRAYAILADLAWIVGHLLWRLRQWILGRPRRSPSNHLRDFLRESALRRGISR